MSSPVAPPVKIEPGWKEVSLPFNIGSGRTIYAGLEQDGRLRLRVFHRPSDGWLVGRAWFGDGADGPPGHAHGGAVAYVLDEAMGAVGWMNGHPMLAAKLEFEYLRKTPLHVDLHVEAQVLEVKPRRVLVEARLKLPTGEICVRGKGEFAVLTRERGKAVEDAGQDPQGFFKKMKLKWAPDDKS